MNKAMVRKFQCLVVFFTTLAIVLIHAGSVGAETFCVTTSAEIQTALTTAQSNGQDDEIHIVQGVYEGNFTYSPEENDELVIQGGYSGPDCAARTADPSNTILDGALAGSVLSVDADWRPADFECDGLTFKKGSADNGGGLLHEGAGDVALTNNIFEENHAERYGGGVNITSSGAITLTGNTIRDNTGNYAAGASISGEAGVFGDSLTMNDNIIAGNASQRSEGGVRAAEFDAVSITNNVFYNNSASWFHGSLFITDSKAVSIINNTITDNQSEGPGAGVSIDLGDDEDTAVVNNNIIQGNYGAPEANDLDLNNDYDGNGTGSPVVLLNNNFDQSATGTSLAVAIAIDPTNLNNVDPSFADAAAGDYRLTAGSPCIDAGASGGVPDADIDGVSRPRRWGVDMGAYEYVGVLAADIKANGSGEAVSVAAGEAVSITVSLDAGDMLGQNADWWVVEAAPAGAFYFLDPVSLSMAPGLSPTLQTPLFSFAPMQLLNLTDLTPGVHTFYFAIDLTMDGEVTEDSLSGDRVIVTIE
ncbi:MAG: hypothetical protein GY859_07140 [Desulfobacterales bacterium]|nr:hypothetical protein [Desulfobacterales bacterium]